jgi:UDP-N-acetylmuramoyl-L-alanyl-D-glutamate--2,6-diaminopimelate ligase
VTGTNGKTSVTSLIKRIIEKCSGTKVGLIGTNGNKIGDRELSTAFTTPESYEMQKLLDKMALEGCENVVMEVSSHALYLSRVYGIEYDVGVFTNLSPEHLDFHHTMEAYAEAKSLLFASCRESVINIDDLYAPLMIKRATGNVTSYAINNPSADLVGRELHLEAEKVEFCAQSAGSQNKVEMPIPGLFSVYNALASIAAATILGFEITDVVSALMLCEGVKGRAEIVPTGREHTVLIDYAHTPDALRNIITAVRGFARGRVVTLFGCGGDRDKAKRPMMGQIAAELSDLVIVTSDNPRTESPGVIINEILSGMEGTKTPFRIIENRREAINQALDDLQSGDVLILAGKGHETYQILGKEKIHFDEREVIADYLKRQRAEGRKRIVEDLD